jgi:hypothetical protein
VVLDELFDHSEVHCCLLEMVSDEGVRVIDVSTRRFGTSFRHARDVRDAMLD